MDIMFSITNNLICVLEAYLMVDFFAAFLPIRKKYDYRYIKPIVILGAAILVRMVNSFNNPSINLISMQFIYFSILWIVFKGTLIKKIFCLLIADSIMIGCEFLWMVLMSYSPEFYISHVHADPSATYFSLLGLKVVTFFFFNLLKRLSKKSEYKMPIQILLLYCVTPLASVGIFFVLGYSYIDYSHSDFIKYVLLGSTILSVLGNILIFYVFDNYAVSMEKLKNQDVIITRLEMEEKRYEQIEAVNREHAGFLHDIRHYLKTIGNMAVNKQEQEILSILQELQVRISDSVMEIYCPDRLLNTILNEKKKEAAENNLEFKLKVEPEFRLDYIEKTDMIAIMSNLFENAMEAAGKCEDGYVKAYLFVQNDSNFSIIKIVNNYAGTIRVSEGEMVSVKEDKTHHGYGIGNVKAAVEKYGGNLQYFYENGVFEAVVVMPNGDR